MRTRYFALIYGIVFVLVGIAGFIPTFLQPPAGMPLALEAGHGRLFGLFPVNYAHDAVHILFGVWGLVAYRTYEASRSYARSVAIIYGVLAVMGLIPGLNTVFGLIPVHSHDIWLHAVLAAVAAYFGFIATGRVPVTVRTGEVREERVRRTGT